MTAAIAILGGQIRTPLVATVVPTSVAGYGSSGAVANITTGLTAATASGGTGPYTYAWAQVGTTPYTWVIGSASAATTSFTCNSLGPGVTSRATFKVTLTDAVGAAAVVTVSAYANNGQPYDDRNTDKTSTQ